MSKEQDRKLYQWALGQGAQIRRMAEGASAAIKPNLDQPKGSGWTKVVDADGVVACEPLGWNERKRRTW